MISLEHRVNAYRQLRGTGLEIGALHEPAPLPAGTAVQYFDAVTEAEAANLFPEIDPAKMVHVDFVGNLDTDGSAQFRDAQFDFVIINHVLEHLSNPIHALKHVFRIVRSGGMAVIAIPDKDYTFDRSRSVTSYEHLWEDYTRCVTENSDEHYLDYLKSAGPHVFAEPAENLALHVARCRTRRDHAHVWTSESFRAFLDETLRRLSIEAECLYEANGTQTQIEYFSLWQKS